MVFKDYEEFNFVVVRSYHEFVDTIAERGVPDFISFDNDLGCNEDGSPLKEGYDCAKWLVFNSGLDIANLEVNVHSANPVAKTNIEFLFRNYFTHIGRK